MSLEFLRTLAKRHTPMDFTLPQDIQQLLVLRAAGLVTAVTLHPKGTPAAGEIARFLALTPAARKALEQAALEASAQEAPVREARVQQRPMR